MAVCEGQRIQIVALEHYSYMSRYSHAHSIGELGGVVRVALHERHIPFVEIPPTCRAKFATGKGNSGKVQVMEEITRKTGIVWEGNDADDRCDAWVLEQMLLAKLGLSSYTWGKEQMKGLEGVEWAMAGL
jgi:Holliday junction resolvasome RuvABC endonuclease subunit